MALVTRALDAAVLTLTLDSPENRNALSRGLVEELGDGLAAAAADDGVRAVVLTHTGRTFCAGADLREAAAEGGPELGTARFVALLRQIVSLPKPVVARVDGHVRAGGLGLLGGCDLVLAGPASTFAFTEVRLGVAPAIIALVTVPRMPERLAARYLLTGETFGPAEAERAGLVTEAADDVDAALATVLDALRLASPQGLAATKPLATARIRAALADGADEMAALSARLFSSAEALEGVTAWAQQRPPRWAVG